MRDTFEWHKGSAAADVQLFSQPGTSVDAGNIVGWIDREYLLKILQVHGEAGR